MKPVRLRYRTQKTNKIKKLILSLLIISGALSLLAQPAKFDRLYYQYRGEEGLVALKIHGFVMRLAGSMADLDQEERALLRSLRTVTVLTIEETHLYPGVNFTEEEVHCLILVFRQDPGKKDIPQDS